MNVKVSDQQIALPFDGETYDPEQDAARLGKQLLAVRDLMLDGIWRTLAEIERETGYPQASVSARLRDLRKEKFGGYVVKRRRSEYRSGTHEYQVTRTGDEIPF